MKPLFFHAVILLASAGWAYAVWSEEEPSVVREQALVDVWGGSQASFGKLAFDGKTRKVRLQSFKDGAGYYYVGSIDKEEAPEPHAGVPGHPESGAAKETKKETVRFVSVKAGETLVESLAPLKALRAVGKVEPARNDEFGLDKPEGTLNVTIDGKEHVLVIGAATPGGGERYAKYQKNGEVFAIASDIAQSLLLGDSRLPERELHGFKNDEVVKVRIQKGGKSRELVRLKEKNDGWADVASPTKQDETAGNWISKLGRLRGSDHVEKPNGPTKPEDALVRVEYFDAGKRVGSAELYKVPPDPNLPTPPSGNKGSDYLIRTEYSRWFVRVPATTAEQLEQDLASVLK